MTDENIDDFESKCATQVSGLTRRTETGKPHIFQVNPDVATVSHVP